MVFDLIEFGEVLWILPIVLFLSILSSALLGAFAQHSTIGKQVAIALGYLFSIGIVVHEGGHQLMCGIFGVKVREASYFHVVEKRVEGKEYLNIGGHIRCEEVQSLIASLFLGFAPLIVNGLLVALIYYFSPWWLETSYSGLFIFLGIGLAFGARPSKQDLTLWVKTIQRHPQRGVLELSFLCIFGVVLVSLILYQVDVWVTLGVSIAVLILCIIQGRNKSIKVGGIGSGIS